MRERTRGLLANHFVQQIRQELPALNREDVLFIRDLEEDVIAGLSRPDAEDVDANG